MRSGTPEYWPEGALIKAAYRLCLLLLAIGFGLSAPAAHAAEPIRLLAFGDSLTAGYGLPPEDGFTAQLQAALTAHGISVVVENAGITGDTTAGGLSRLDWSLADKPDAVLLELGANDMLRGINPLEPYTNLDRILTRLQAAKLPVLLCGMRAATNWGPEYQQKFDDIYPTLARKYGVPLYPFFLDGVALDPVLTQPDGLHPTKAGVAVIVARILPVVEKLLKPLQSPS